MLPVYLIIINVINYELSLWGDGFDLNETELGGKEYRCGYTRHFPQSSLLDSSFGLAHS